MSQQDRRDVIAVLTDDHREIERLLTRFAELPRTDAAGRRELAEAAVMEIVQHAAAEERHLYPAARRLPGGDEIADQQIEGHTAAERTMKELDRIDTADPHFDEVFARLAREVREHVAGAERDLFPRLAEAFDEDELAALGHQVERAKRTAPTRPHPSGPAKPPLNRLVGPGTALVDKARDAIGGRGRPS